MRYWPVRAAWAVTAAPRLSGPAEAQRSVQDRESWQYHRTSSQASLPSGTI